MKIFTTLLALLALHKNCYGTDSSTHVLHSRDCGMFSIFKDVVNCLHAYDQNKIEGLLIDFDKTGLYYDPERGNNWWTYYFEPIALGHISGDPHFILSSNAVTQDKKTIQDHHNVIKKYIILKPHIQQKIDSFVNTYFKGLNIGIHYRGTDKKTENVRVDYDAIIKIAREKIKGKNNYTIFVATDEQHFLEEVIRQFPHRVCYIDAVRSQDNDSPIHTDSNRNPYLCGESALIDCVLLSKTHFLIRTESNLSDCTRYFNPQLKGVLVIPNGKTYFPPNK